LEAEFFEVAIVGGGPAGAMAACELGQAGVRTVLIDKAELPRYKVCGGGLVFRGRQLLPEALRQHPSPALQEALEVSCGQINVYNNQYRDRYSAQRSEPLVTMVMRDRFDHALVQHAQGLGVRVITGEAVRGLDRSVDAHGGSVIDLHTDQRRCTARAVIVADGATSPTAKLAGFVDDRQFIPALECEVWVGEADFARLQDDPRFDMDAIPHGYGWSFPKRDHLSIGVALFQKDDGDKTALKQHYQRYLQALGIQEVLRTESHGFVIPVSLRQGSLCQGGVMLVGDAAGTADALTAEGISNAMLTGQQAAQALASSRNARGEVQAATAAARYDAFIDQALRPQLHASARLSKFFYGNAVLRNLLLKQFGQQLADRVADVFMGTKGYPSDVQASIWKRLKGSFGSFGARPQI